MQSSLARTIRDRRERLVGRVLEQLVTGLDAYQSLPPEALSGDITAAVERGIDLFLATMSTGEPLTAGELVELGESAARRAEERIPLQAVLGAYLVAVRVVVADLADSDEVSAEDLATGFVTSLTFLQSVAEVVVDRYVDEREMISDARSQVDRSRLNALLEGTVTDVSFPEMAPYYLVLRLAIGPHADEIDPGVDGAIAARRKLRRVRHELAGSSDLQTLSALNPNGGIILLGVTGEEVGAGERGAVDDLVDRLAEAAGAEVHAAVELAAASEVTEAGRLTEELIELLPRIGRPPGLYRLDDVVVEFQLSRPGPARDRLVARVRPLTSRPDLVQTLRSYIRVGRNRRQTALDLHVHPNTVDYRLRRIRAIVGLDPTDPDDMSQLSAALIARDAAGA